MATEFASSVALLSSFLNISDAELVSEIRFLTGALQEGSVLSQVAQFGGYHSTTSNKLLAQWTERVMSLMKLPDDKSKEAGLVYLRQIVQAATPALLRTTCNVLVPLLMEFATAPLKADPTVCSGQTLSGFRLLLDVLHRCSLWPDTHRQTSSFVTKFVTNVLSLANQLLSAASPIDGTGSLLQLSNDRVTPLLGLLALLHDSLSRTPFNARFRAHCPQIEALAWRCADIDSPVELSYPASILINSSLPTTSSSLTLRSLAIRIIALCPYVLTLKQVWEQEDTSTTSASSASKASVTVVTAQVDSTDSSSSTEVESKLNDKTNKSNSAVGGGSNRRTLESGAPWMIYQQRIASTLIAEMARCLPKQALDNASLQLRVAASSLTEDPFTSFTHLSTHSLPSSSASSPSSPTLLPSSLRLASALRHRMTNLLSLSTALFLNPPQSPTYTLDAATLSSSSNLTSKGGKNDASGNHKATEEGGLASAILEGAHQNIVSVVDPRILTAVPMHELLSTIQLILSLDPIPDTGLSIHASDTFQAYRITPQAYKTLLVPLQLHALATLRVLLIAVGRQCLPHARSIGTWLTSIIAKTTASTQLLARSPNLSRDALRSGAIACFTSLIYTVGVPPIYRGLVEVVLPQVLNNVASYISATLRLQRSSRPHMLLQQGTEGMEETDNSENMSTSAKKKLKKQQRKEEIDSIVTASLGASDGLSSSSTTTASSSSKGSTSTTGPTPTNTQNSVQQSHGPQPTTQLGRALATLANTSRGAAEGAQTEQETVASQAIADASLSFTRACITSPGFAVVANRTIRAAIDRTILTAALSGIDPTGRPILALPTPFLRSLLACFVDVISLPGPAIHLGPTLAPYASALLTWGASSNDITTATVCTRGLNILRTIYLPTHQPPPLPAQVLTSFVEGARSIPTISSTPSSSVPSMSSSAFFPSFTPNASGSSAPSSLSFGAMSGSAKGQSTQADISLTQSLSVHHVTASLMGETEDIEEQKEAKERWNAQGLNSSSLQSVEREQVATQRLKMRIQELEQQLKQQQQQHHQQQEQDRNTQPMNDKTGGQASDDTSMSDAPLPSISSNKSPSAPITNPIPSSDVTSDAPSVSPSSMLTKDSESTNTTLHRQEQTVTKSSETSSTNSSNTPSSINRENDNDIDDGKMEEQTTNDIDNHGESIDDDDNDNIELDEDDENGPVLELVDADVADVDEETGGGSAGLWSL